MTEEFPNLEGIEIPSDPPLAEPPGQGRDAVWKTGRKKGRSRLRKQISRNLGYVAVRAVHAVVCRLPWPLGRALAWICGSVAYTILKRERDIALQSLTRVYGADKPPSEIRRMVREVFRSSAGIIVDWVILRRWPRGKLEARFPHVAETLRQIERDVRATGSGMIIMTAHLGNWELLGHMFSQFTPGLIMPLAKRMYFPKYDEFLHRLRTEHGLEVMRSDESPRKMLQAVRNGVGLSFLCDQDLRTNSGVFVDFFGLPTYTVTFPVDIARKLGVKMVGIFLVKEGNSFRAIYEPPFDVAKSGDDAADVLAWTQKWTTVLEAAVRRYPTQWAWIHPRWRSTPEKPRLQLDSKRRKERHA